jgi:aminoglycoside 3-N-acetyltransferase
MDSGSATCASLFADARRLGLGPGDTVMLHASLRALGPVLGGPDALIDALLAAVGPDGSLMMYVGCEPPYDHIGRKPLDRESEAFLVAHLPPFDPATARADRDFGALAELFRTHLGTRCSTNPGARMAALGAGADWLTRDQPMNYSYGPGSPLGKLCEAGGKVMLIGSDPDAVTLLHHAEHLAPIPDKRVLRLRTPIAGESGGRWVEWEEFDTTSRGIVDWPEQFFAMVMADFAATGQVTTGRLGQADVMVFDAQALVDHAVAMMVRVAAELAAGD